MISVPRHFALLALLAATACQHGGRATTTPERAAADTPQQLARAGRFEDAAEAWLAQASQSRDGAAPLRLDAAEAYLHAGNLARASEILEAVEPSDLPRGDRSRRSVLLARTALAGASAGEALAALPPLDALLEHPEPTAALEIAIRIAREANRAVDEVRFRNALDPRLPAPDRNRDALWKLVRGLPAPALEHPPKGAEGWFELERLARAYRTHLPAFYAELRGWRERNAGHPAVPTIVERLVERVRREAPPPRHVALLLPLTGTFAPAAAAVRDGFLAGWYAGGGERPLISVFDTTRAPLEEVYAAVAAEGTDFIVGPLRKEAAAQIAAVPDRAIPVLLLNVLDEETEPPARLEPRRFEFALSPESEARSVAAFARTVGHRRAGLLVPDTDWGKRVARAFARDFERAGGVVVSRASYRSGAEDLSGPVRSLLGIDAGEARAKRLRQTIRRRFVHEARPRSDLDFVFLAGFPREARRLRPQITFYRAPDLPIYSTSHIYTGVSAPAQDSDLDGVVFSDLPWVLGQPSSSENRALREKVIALWPEASGGFTRYFAFGIDAYRLQRRLPELTSRPAESLPGHTGRLGVGDGGRIHIDMAWARFENGIPVPLPPAT